jgi:hypothetical protein
LNQITKLKLCDNGECNRGSESYGTEYLQNIWGSTDNEVGGHTHCARLSKPTSTVLKVVSSPIGSAWCHPDDDGTERRTPETQPGIAIGQFELWPIQHLGMFPKVELQLPPLHHWKRVHVVIEQHASEHETASTAAGTADSPKHWWSLASCTKEDQMLLSLVMLHFVAVGGAACAENRLLGSIQPSGGCSRVHMILCSSLKPVQTFEPKQPMNCLGETFSMTNENVPPRDTVT